ncbi:MAG: flagellar hook-associated protein FlgK [Granulosicoccus sp.]
MTDILSTGKSALFAFQRALSTTSHNIANVNTEGYSRQRVDFESLPGNGQSNISVGRGVHIANIERLGDQFASARVSAATSAHAEQEVHYQLASRLDNLVATEGMSIAPALNNFFNSIQDANADPSSVASREVVIENAKQLADRFKSMQGQLDESQEEVNARTNEAVKMADQYGQSIAEINKQIIATASGQNSQQAHDLKDQREQLVQKLSKYMDVDTLIQDNGAMNVFVGKGISLVTDGRSQRLSTVRDHLYPQRVQIQIGEDNNSLLLSAQIQGGIIGGLNDFSDNTLDLAMHELGRLSLTVADEVNMQHALGVDLDGNPGTDIFGSTEPVVFSDTRNTGNGLIRGRITDTQALQASDYVLRYDGASFTATRSLDGQTTTSGIPLILDGMALTMTGTPVAGDVFVVSATGRAASTMDILIENPDKLALAGQLTTASDIGNLGDSKISEATVTDPEDIDLTTPVDIIFVSDTAYDIVNSNTGAVLQGNVGYVESDTISLNGWDIKISGDAKTGDTHSVSPNVSGRGNNSNGLALAGMQTGLHVNGTESFSDAYGSLVSRIGSNTNAAGTRTTALESLKDNAIDRQQSTQGVSLDEEAIDLTRYQQAYQAAAQVISASETLFQSILGAIR